MVKNGGKESGVSPFKFTSFEMVGEHAAPTWESYQIPELGGVAANRTQVSPKVIRAEREAEEKTQFKIDNIVRDLRGLTGQEKSDFEAKVGAEVERRMKEAREKAYKEGIDRGRLEGSDAALKEAMARHQANIEKVAALVEELQQNFQEKLERNRSEIYEMTKRLLKWLVLKEVKDTDYLPKLLEKLILEMNQKQNILVRVNPQDFASMPEVLEMVQQRVGKLTNVRVEPLPETHGRGIVLETENGIIDASPEAMFQTLDKLFEAVVNHGGE